MNDEELNKLYENYRDIGYTELKTSGLYNKSKFSWEKLSSEEIESFIDMDANFKLSRNLGLQKGGGGLSAEVWFFNYVKNVMEIPINKTLNSTPGFDFIVGGKLKLISLKSQKSTQSFSLRFGTSANLRISNPFLLIHIHGSQNIKKAKFTILNVYSPKRFFAYMFGPYLRYIDEFNKYLQKDYKEMRDTFKAYVPGSIGKFEFKKSSQNNRIQTNVNKTNWNKYKHKIKGMNVLLDNGTLFEFEEVINTLYRH